MGGSESLEVPAEFAAFHERFSARFVRAEVRERSARYLQGLLGPVERKNGWQLAEAAGERDPAGMQRLLYAAAWEADEVLGDYQTWAVEQFGNPAAIVVFDETGFVKKGTKSVGVQRQYSGTAGKVENCQVGVFMAYVTPSSHVLLDRRLYLPAVWSDDPARRTEAQVPASTTFQTIPQLALAMLRAAWQRGVPQAWVAADEAYGKDPAFLTALEQHGQRYVIAVATTAPVWAERPNVVVGPRGGRHLAAEASPVTTAAAIVAGWPAAAWQRLIVGMGTKGPRVYDWAAARVVASRDQLPGPALWLVARRSPNDPAEVAYYLAFAPPETPLATLAEVAAARWPVEQCFEEAKGETGLDHYEVRSWHSWHRHITLAMLAHGFLAWQRREAGGKSSLSRRPGIRTRAGAAERTRTAASARGAAATPTALASVSRRVVAVAPTPSVHCPAGPLPLAG